MKKSSSSKLFFTNNYIMFITVLILMILIVPAFAEGANTPITLDQALEIAFKNSPDIKIAADQVAKSAGGVDESKANFMPKINAEVNHVRQGPEVSITLPDNGGTANIVSAQNTTGAVNATYPVDIFNKLGYVSDLSKLQLQIDLLNYQGTAQNLIYNVKEAYYNLLRAEDGLEVAKSSVDSSQARLDNVRFKYEAGTVPKFDVTRGEVEIANLTQTFIGAKNNVEIARAALNNTLGINVGLPTEVVKTDIVVDQIKPDLDESIKSAYAKRPEAKIAQTLVTIGDKNVKLQRTDYLPTLGLSGTFNYNFKISGFSASNGSWVAAAALSIPIWNGGITQAKVKQANADLSKANNTLDKTKLAIALDVKVAVLNLQNATERVNATSQSVSLAEESLRLANVRYEAGISTLVEVTDANNALTLARSNNINAQYDYTIAVAALQKAVSNQPEIASIKAIKASL